MIHSPSNANPYANTIDATLNNTFSCVINADGGTQTNAYNLTISDMSGTSIYTTGKQTLSSVLYNEDTLSIIVPNTSGMINGNDYVWNVKVYEANPSVYVAYGLVQSGTNTTTNIYLRQHYNVEAGMYLKIGNETKLISSYSSSTGLAVVSTAFGTVPTTGKEYNVYANNVNTDDIYFKARKTPAVSITNFVSSIATKSYTFNGSYTQIDNIPWRNFTFNLYDSNDDLIKTSDKINYGLITYKFDGLLSGNTYKIELVIENQDDVIITAPKQSFTVSYAETVLLSRPSTEVIESKDAIMVSWGQLYNNTYVSTGAYSFVSDIPFTTQTSLYLPNESKLEYNISTITANTYFPYNSATYLRCKFGIGFEGEFYRQENKNTGDFYSVSYLDGAFTFNINGYYIGTINIHAPNSAWLLTTDALYDSYKRYAWDDSMVWNDSLQWFTQTNDVINENWFNLILLPDDMVLKMGNTIYASSKTIDTSKTLPSQYNHVILSGEQTIDYIWIENKIPNLDEVLERQAIDYVPDWIGNTTLLAKFNNNLFAGNVDTYVDTLTAWSVYRNKIGSATLDFVKTVDASIGSVIDYAVANHTNYKYYVFAETANTIGSPMISNQITTNWWNWSITDIVKSSNNEYVVDTDNIWNFELNIESSAIIQNVDKFTYETSSEFSKVSIGKRNYKSSSISCLLGSIENDGCEYINDTSDIQDKFCSFIINGNLKLLKDAKGNTLIVDIDTNSWKIYDDIIGHPTTLTFTWKQISVIDGMSIIEE